MAYSAEDRENITVRGIRIDYHSTRMVKQYQESMRKENWEREKHDFIKMNQYWYVFIGHLNRDHIAKIAGLKIYDFAVPQDWFDANMKEIKRRGGAIWVYDGAKCRMFGCPMFWDDVENIAIETMKKYSPKIPMPPSRYPHITHRRR